MYPSLFFSAYAPKLQWRRFPAVIIGIEDTLEWFQCECNLLPSGSVSLDKRFVYEKESILVRFKVSYIYIYKVNLVLDRNRKVRGLPKAYKLILFRQAHNYKQDFKYFAIFFCWSTNRKDSQIIQEGKSFEFFCWLK